MTIQLNKLLEIAKKASVLAGKEIMEVYSSADFNVEMKSDNSPLTLADKKAHDKIVSLLNQTDYPILSEEGRSIDFEERKSWDVFWMVDPLDGTKEFVKRNGEFTVNIALIKGSKPILGVVFCPVLNKLYYATQESGSFLEDDDGSISSISVSKRKLNEEGLRLVASRSHLNEDTQAFIDSLSNPKLVSMGSSLKLLAIAEGTADVYPRFAPTMEWDTAAAHAIVSGAGGRVLIQNSNEEVKYNKANLLNPFFLVVSERI